MNVLITGAAGGIGSATAEYFLQRGHTVHGLDIAPARNTDTSPARNTDAPPARNTDTSPARNTDTSPARNTDAPPARNTDTSPARNTDAAPASMPSSTETDARGTYIHHIADVTDPGSLPAFAREEMPEVLVCCAGVQDSGNDIEVNLKGTINVTERYAIGSDRIRSVVIVGSASAHTGSEFPEYAASKGGLLSYTKNAALRLAPNAICNSIDPGGVLTDLNRCVMEDEKLWQRIMELTPLKRWASPEEIAEWIYFVGVTNRFMTGQNLLIDGGEAGDMHFIWPE